jgi:transposase InsO family protein
MESRTFDLEGTGPEERGRVEGGAEPLPASGSPPPPPPQGGARAAEAASDVAGEAEEVDRPLSRARLTAVGRARVARTVRAEEAGPREGFTAQQRLLLLDTWRRSALPATEFSVLVGVSAHTLYEWKRRFETRGPAGLSTKRGARRRGSQVEEPVRRAILMMKEAHPDWGQERLSDMLNRAEGFAVSAGAIGRVLSEGGYVVEQARPRPNEPQVQRFERARPNELWQTDLFTFLLRRENRRVHLVAFMDDHSRFIVGYGLHASASGALVREVLEAAIASFGAPVEVLTDNGPQYVTWRGTSAFARLLERRGIRHVVARPRNPRTLGKAERFWGTLWRELLSGAIFQGLEDARRRIGQFVDWYNFQRCHQGIGGLVPADRFFAASPEVRQALQARVARNAEELAKQGAPRKGFYLTGRVGDRPISLHAEGERVVLVDGGQREEVDLSAPGRRAQEGEASEVPEPVAVTAIVPDLLAPQEGEEEPAPGASPLDEALERLEGGERAHADDAQVDAAQVDDAPGAPREGGGA